MKVLLLGVFLTVPAVTQLESEAAKGFLGRFVPAIPDPKHLELEWEKRLPTADEINEVAVTWKAAEYDRFADMTFEEIIKTHGGCSLKDDTRQVEEKPLQAGLSLMDLPAEFDARDKWPGCAGRILNQAHCGGCWAFGAVETLGFRFCAAAGVHVALSPQELISCAKPGFGCGGGYPSSAFAYMMQKGVRTTNCMPYVDGNKNASPSSATQCPRDNGCTNRNSSSRKYFAEKYYTLATSTRNWNLAATAIMQDLQENGPIEVTFTVYTDFYQYRSGVYQHTMGKSVGGHAVMLLGWGVENGTPYWLLQNSWGPYWGENGLFKMVRREDQDLGITVGAVSGEPKVSLLGRIRGDREWPWAKKHVDA